MRLGTSSSIWWGPPKKFDPHFEERRISWLELFYDLVYVIAISRITHHLTMHINWAGFMEYGCLFALIFWGWLNGSLYHDIHGNAGLRTRLMTLWQVMIIAALAVTIDQSSTVLTSSTTIVFMIMQVFVTYLWWSVGFYDKDHRRYNLPYTILFLIALALMGISLFISSSWLKIIVPLILICNYAPPFIAHRLLRRSSLNLSLSSSMAERLGLFTIIVFGEVVLGVVNGISRVDKLNLTAWIHFGLALSIIFSLWWMFFTLTSNRVAKEGFVNATLLELLCLPTLMALGMIAASSSYMLNPDEPNPLFHTLFSIALAIFLGGISLIMRLLEYPDIVGPIKGPVRLSLFVTALAFVAFGFVERQINITTMAYLVTVIFILVVEIVYLNSLYYSLKIEEGEINKIQSSSET